MTDNADNSAETSAKTSAETRAAGRGVIYIAFAKLYFMIAGAVIEFRLPAIVSEATFGAWGVVVSVVSPFNNVLITGTIQAVSRFTAQRPEKARLIQAAGVRMHLYVGVPVAILFIAVSPVVGWLMQDTSKVPMFMLAGLIVLTYSFYAVFVGTANGRKEFHKQAGLDITMATMRAAAILGMFTAGLGVIGAISGWVGAAACILVIAAVIVGMPKRSAPGERQSLRPLLSFFASVAVYLILLNFIMQVDTYLLKSLSTSWFLDTRDAALEFYKSELPSWAAAGISELDPSKAADGQVGYYRAVQNLARLSYQAIIAATFVIFPLVSRTTFDNDEGATRRYITTSVRYSLIFAMAIAVVFAANPETLLDIPYSDVYAKTGALALIALSLGSVAFCLFAIAGTILNGAGLTRDAIISAAVTLAVAVVGNAIVVPRFEPGRELLFACGLATGGAMVVGAIVSGYLLRRRLGAFVPAKTVVRVLIAAGGAIAIGRVIPFRTPLMTMVEAVVVGISFLAILIATRELTGADLRAVLAPLSKRKAS